MLFQIFYKIFLHVNFSKIIHLNLKDITQTKKLHTKTTIQNNSTADCLFTNRRLCRQPPRKKSERGEGWCPRRRKSKDFPGGNLEKVANVWISFFWIKAAEKIRKIYQYRKAIFYNNVFLVSRKKKKCGPYETLWIALYVRRRGKEGSDLIPSALLYVDLIIRLTMFYLKKTGGCFTRPPNKTNNFPKGKPK